MRPDWVPSRPRDGGVHRRRYPLRPAPAASPAASPPPRHASHLRASTMTRQHRGFTHVHPPGLSLTWPPDGRGPFGLTPGFAPRSYPQRTPGRGQATGTGQKLCHRHHRPSSLQAHSQPCDLVSHVLSPVIAHEQPHRSPVQMPKQGSSQRENHQRPNETVLTPSGGHDIPAAINSPGHRQGHGLSAGLKARENKCSPAGGHHHTESAVQRTR